MMNDGRNVAMEQMINDCLEKRGNAILAMRSDTESFDEGWCGAKYGLRPYFGFRHIKSGFQFSLKGT